MRPRTAKATSPGRLCALGGTSVGARRRSPPGLRASLEGLTAWPTRHRPFIGTRRWTPDCSRHHEGNEWRLHAPWDAAAASKNRLRTALRDRSVSPVPDTTAPPAWAALTGSGPSSRGLRSGRGRPRRPVARARSPGSRRRSLGTAGSRSSTTPAVCSVVAGEVTLLAAGPCTLAAAQPGYLEAQQSFAVERSLQQVGFSSATPADAVEGGPGYQPLASASSGLPVALVSLTPAVCAIQGTEVAPQAAGLCTIAAEQSGDAEYEPAPPATQSYPVAAAPAGGPPSGGAPAAGGPAAEVLSLHENATPFTAHPALRLHRTPLRVAARRSDHPLADRLTEWNAEVADDLYSHDAVFPAHLLLCSGAGRFAAGPGRHAPAPSRSRCTRARRR